LFRGAITTLLPADANVSTPENMFGSNKLFALRVRGATPSGSIRWLTVLDTPTSAGGVALASRIQTMTANGALLTAADGTSTVVLFGLGAAGTPITSAIAYSEPATATTVVVTDLAPNTPYAVTTTLGAGTHDVRIEAGASAFMSSAAGTL